LRFVVGTLGVPVGAGRNAPLDSSVICMDSGVLSAEAGGMEVVGRDKSCHLVLIP